MKRISKNCLFIILFFCGVFILTALVSGLSLFYSANTSSIDFSVDNMAKHVEIISKEEHSVFHKSNIEEVRNYIVDTLNSYGVNNTMINHTTEYIYNWEYQESYPCDIKNIYAEIPGNSGTNILLMAHYDSCPFKIKYGQITNNSHGAFDDGFGVATLLEIARIYAKETNLVNGIKLVFTDAEEVGMRGADAIFDYHRDWLNDVNLVINVEGRGNTGPVYLYETSKNNGKLINFYQKAGFPFAFSVAADVYGMMPNGTDLGVFIDNGFNSLNIATLDGLEYYHTEKDNFNNIDKNSLKAYGDTVLPLLEEYTLNDKYAKMDAFDCNYDSVFTTILPGVMINLHPTVAIVLLCIVGAMIVALLVVYLVKKYANFGKIMLSMLFDLLTVGVACGIGFALIMLLCAIFNLQFNFMYVVKVPCDKLILILLSALMFGLTLLVSKLKTKLKINKNDQIIAGLLFYLILSVVSSIVLFSSSIIFVIPTLLFTVCAFINLIRHTKTKNIMSGIFVGIASVLVVNLFVYYVYSIFVSLSFGSLGVLLILATLPFILTNPFILNLEFVKKEQ